MTSETPNKGPAPEAVASPLERAARRQGVDIDRRDHVSTVMDRGALINPRGVSIVGTIRESGTGAEQSAAR